MNIKSSVSLSGNTGSKFASKTLSDMNTMQEIISNTTLNMVDQMSSNMTSNIGREIIANISSDLGFDISSNMTSDTNKTSDDHSNVLRRCSYNHLEYCHPYIKNVFVLYTGSGGWLLLAVVVLCCSLQVYCMVKHKLDRRKHEKYMSVIQRDLVPPRRTFRSLRRI